MADHFEEYKCEACGKRYRVGWSVPDDMGKVGVVPAVSHCPTGKRQRIVGLRTFEELRDGNWVAVEPYTKPVESQ